VGKATYELRVLTDSSAGGHLAQLLRLETWCARHDVRWVCSDLPDAASLLPPEHTAWTSHPNKRNDGNLWRNSLLAWHEIRRGRPDMVVSCGAGIAVPFVWVGKLFGAKTVFIEVIDRIDTRTLTAALGSPVTDLSITRMPSQGRLFPGSHLIGRLL
jgi:beta-1,4-N-acetylglucosaminyltransferase